MNNKIYKSVEELPVWLKSYQLTLKIYNLTKSFNQLAKEAQWDLLIYYVYMLCVDPTSVTKMWTNYNELFKKVIISAVCDQYNQLDENLKPQNNVWRDPRKRADQGTFYKAMPVDMELCFAAIPKQAFLDVGGFDEEYDRAAALGEKEGIARMFKAGYETYLDQSLEYRAFKHDRLGGNEEWEKHYKIAQEMYARHIQEINEGKRLKITNNRGY